jgi:hypothetical protein
MIDNIAEVEAVVSRETDLLATPGKKETWRERRDEYVKDMVNLTDLLVAVAVGEGPIDRIEHVTRRPTESASTL